MNFIIDTPSHKRWWLPDNTHMYNSVIYGDDHQMCVMTAIGNHIDYLTLKLSDPDWKKLSEAHQEAMKKKYPKYKFFKITAAVGGSLDRVIVEMKDIYYYGERNAVAHAAWRKLCEGKTRKMLLKLCDTYGVEWVKQNFTAGIQYEQEL